MEFILLIAVIALIVFLFGLYADSGGSKSQSQSAKIHNSISYSMVSKKDK